MSAAGRAPLRIVLDPPTAAEVAPGTVPAGWWVSLDYVEHPMAFGPYATEQAAMDAMEDSLLIDGQCCDTKHPDTLDDVHVLPAPCPLSGIVEAYGPDHVVIIDPDDPDHHGRPGGGWTP